MLQPIALLARVYSGLRRSKAKSDHVSQCISIAHVIAFLVQDQGYMSNNARNGHAGWDNQSITHS